MIIMKFQNNDQSEFVIANNSLFNRHIHLSLSLVQENLENPIKIRFQEIKADYRQTQPRMAR